MNIIHLKKTAEPEELLQTPVPKAELSKMNELKPNSVLQYEDGAVVFATLGNEDLKKCRETILKAPTGFHTRLANVNKNEENAQRSSDTTFGYKPSRPVFGHSAGPVRFTIDYPKSFQVLTELGKKLEDLAIRLIGEEFERQVNKAKSEIIPDYRIGDTSFTQGVINRTNALHWHYDRGNYDNSYSAMLWVIEGGISGGELVIPSFNAYATPIDGGIIIFKGQNLVHGVAPVIRTKPRSERMSVVFYTIAGMAKALTPEKELEKSKLREFRKHFK